MAKKVRKKATKSENVEPTQSGAGRPEVELDLEQLAALCRMKPSLYDCAAFFKCSERTIERRVKDTFGINFVEFRDQNLMHTKYDLIRKAIKKAETSETMHKFCLKNLADWKERTDVTSDDEPLPNPPQVIIKLPSNGRERT